MKIRKVWLYTCNGFWGTCDIWASELEADGAVVTKTRVLWKGKLPVCSSCLHGAH